MMPALAEYWIGFESIQNKRVPLCCLPNEACEPGSIDHALQRFRYAVQAL